MLILPLNPNFTTIGYGETTDGNSNNFDCNRFLVTVSRVRVWHVTTLIIWFLN